MLPDGTERFRYRLILAARQNGKSEIVVGLVPYWMFVERVEGVLAASTKVPMAKKLWGKTRKVIKNCDLVKLLGKTWYREANGEVELWTPERTARGEPWDSHYAIDASNEEGGRSLTLNRLIIDELRHHYDYKAWGALVRTMGAVEGSHAWLLSNAGSDRSIVLNNLRDGAVEELPDGTEVARNDPDTNLFLAEWSSERGADPTDVHALGQANPNMNRRGQKSKDLVADAQLAVDAGGEALTEYQTEVMCIRVKVLNPAVDPGAWSQCLDPGPITDRRRTAMVLDVSLDLLHATLYAAVVEASGRTRVDFVRDWAGPGCGDRAVAALPGLLADMRPAMMGWLPNGPAAALGAKLKDRGVPGWPPLGVTVEEIRGEVAAVCMGLAELVAAGKIAHSADPLLDAQVGAAEKLRRGDVWVFARAGEGHVDAVYAAAGAVHLARTMPPALGKFKIR